MSLQNAYFPIAPLFLSPSLSIIHSAIAKKFHIHYRCHVGLEVVVGVCWSGHYRLIVIIIFLYAPT